MPTASPCVAAAEPHSFRGGLELDERDADGWLALQSNYRFLKVPTNSSGSAVTVLLHCVIVKVSVLSSRSEYELVITLPYANVISMRCD